MTQRRRGWRRSQGAVTGDTVGDSEAREAQHRAREDRKKTQRAEQVWQHKEVEYREGEERKRAQTAEQGGPQRETYGNGKSLEIICSIIALLFVIYICLAQ